VKPTLDNLLDENRQQLERIARQYAAPGDWQDLFQDMVFNIWKGLESFRGQSKPSTWVYRIAINTALQFVRKRQLDTTPISEHPIPDREAGDMMPVLEAFLQSLDPANRALLLLDLEGVPKEDIAEVLGISVGAVAVRMTRLKARFNDEFVVGQ
jgi:RNA polymerase sigma-70 factor (ECF subfamily)